MKNKKGFTLIEIIVCLVLITAIGTGVTLTIVKNDNPQEKIDNVTKVVKSASEVYLSANTQLVDKLNKNQGFLVLDVQELIELGYLKTNIFDDIENISNGYDKVILKKRDIDDLDYIYKENEGSFLDIGLYDVIYPYKENENKLILFDKPILIYNSDNISEDIRSNCLLEELIIFDENYNKKNTPFGKYFCSELTDENIIKQSNEIKYIKYKYDVYEGYRKVENCKKRDIVYYLENSKREYDGYWTNKYIKVFFGSSDSSFCDDYFKLNTFNKAEEEVEENLIKESGKYNSIISFNGEIKETKIKNVYIDQTEPELSNISRNGIGPNYILELNDNESGLDLENIRIDGEKINLDNISCAHETDSSESNGGPHNCEIKISNNFNTIEYGDIAGNKVTSQLDSLDIKTISYNVIDSTKFKVKLKKFNDRDFTLKYFYNNSNSISISQLTDEGSNKNDNEIERTIDILSILTMCGNNDECKNSFNGNLFREPVDLRFQIIVDEKTYDFKMRFNIYFDKNNNILIDTGHEKQFNVLGVNSFGNVLFEEQYNRTSSAYDVKLHLLDLDLEQLEESIITASKEKNYSTTYAESCGDNRTSSRNHKYKLIYEFNDENVILYDLERKYYSSKKCSSNKYKTFITTYVYNIFEKSVDTDNDTISGRKESENAFDSYENDMIDLSFNFVDEEISNNKSKIIDLAKLFREENDYYLDNVSKIISNDETNNIDKFVYSSNTINKKTFISYCENKYCKSKNNSRYLRILYFNYLELIS